ncbi:MAG: 1-acyl-sn-glycerol-3-phosphate acyltransferase [Candidatus Limnocylindrales bacterium]
MRQDLRRFSETLARLPARQGRLESCLRRAFMTSCRVVGWSVRIELVGPLPVAGGRPGAGCIVVAAPHRAWLEPFLLLAAWPPGAARLVWLADARTITRSWWRRLLLPRVGVLPVTPGSGSPRRYVEAAAAATRAGHAVAVFPEVGPPSPPERVRRISPGFAYLAVASGAPVVPVVIGGTHRIVRGSSFSVGIGRALGTGAAMDDPFVPAGRERAAVLTEGLTGVLEHDLPARNAWADERAPERERWPWLATLFG